MPTPGEGPEETTEEENIAYESDLDDLDDQFAVESVRVDTSALVNQVARVEEDVEGTNVATTTHVSVVTGDATFSEKVSIVRTSPPMTTTPKVSEEAEEETTTPASPEEEEVELIDSGQMEREPLKNEPLKEVEVENATLKLIDSTTTKKASTMGQPLPSEDLPKPGAEPEWADYQAHPAWIPEEEEDDGEKIIVLDDKAEPSFFVRRKEGVSHLRGGFMVEVKPAKVTEHTMIHLTFGRVDDTKEEGDMEKAMKSSERLSFALRHTQHEVELRPESEGWYAVCGEAVRDDGVVLQRECFRTRVQKTSSTTTSNGRRKSEEASAPKIPAV